MQTPTVECNWCIKNGGYAGCHYHFCSSLLPILFSDYVWPL